ncbi:ribosome small subunit-dependent GTPase A [Tissierella creatinophila]|uniref:Small ribosomal subunit biogenesis GTPase RsgA n=1 Tax=Tissierella creatinophila DSM 6911 TaxID=1123403 RepID=A0A1U7M317_TISCR|nr:ribosome small subunit-dependent GTPase A [Tissierella creatinophila]OLS01714.1 putative ribosome biogenesis GTPase RsgA [Tissierella creatinophila DSM 6911]
MLEGRIVKGVGGIYSVKTSKGVIKSRARGVFRVENLTPLIGDFVNIKISSEDNMGYIIDIKPRNTELLRPPVANITQAIVVMSVKNPDINTWLLDKFLLMAEYEGLHTVVVFNKSDLDSKEAEKLKVIYESAGYEVIIASTKLDIGIESLKNHLKDNISVFAGPSGVGKSSILNKIHKGFKLDTGDISSKNKRGKHTTRHIELLELDHNSFVLDSPGFSSLNLDFIENESEVRDYFKEIHEYGKDCKFLSCLHNKEPGCSVKDAVEKNIINKKRYDNYLLLLEEVKNIRRY